MSIFANFQKNLIQRGESIALARKIYYARAPSILNMIRAILGIIRGVCMFTHIGQVLKTLIVMLLIE